MANPPIRTKNSTKETVEVTVIVATHNSVASIKRFLELMKDIPMEPEWELIIANCSSTDDTGKILAEALQVSSIQLNVVTVGSASLCHGRNNALKYAKGQIVIFADDDIIPDMFWLKEFHEAAKKYGKGKIFGGRVFVDSAKLPQWLLKSPGYRQIITKEHDLGDAVRTYKFNEYPSRACIGVRKTLLDANQDPWPRNIGPGTDIAYAEELAFCYFLNLPDAKDRVYIPSATVTKKIDLKQIAKPGKIGYCFGYVTAMLVRMFKLDKEKVTHSALFNQLKGFSLTSTIKYKLGLMRGNQSFRNKHQFWPL